MPIPLTVFAANQLIFVNLALAIATLAALLLPARKQIVRWVVAAVITLALSLALARSAACATTTPARSSWKT
jgi:hypothetical protein